MAGRKKHTCRRATHPETRKLYPETCRACANIVAETTTPKEPTSVTTVSQDPEVGTPPAFVPGHEPEAAPDDLPPPNPIGVIDPDAAPAEAVLGQTEGAELSPLEQAKALLRTAGLTVIDPEEVRAELAAGGYNASVMAPVGAPTGWQAEVNEPVMVFERDYANGIVQKLRDENGTYYLYQGKRYRKSVAVERQVLPNGQLAPLIDGYSYTLYP